MKLVYTLIFLFVLAQVIGIFTGTIILKDIYGNPYVQFFFLTDDSSSISSSLFLFLYILVSSFVLLLLIRFFSKYVLFFKLLEFVIISTSSSIVIYSFFRLFLSYEHSMMGGILIGLFIAALKFLNFKIKNIVAILSTAGVGVIFGISFEIIPIIVFLVLLSIYDYLSVFRTKHMVELANFVMKEDLAFTITASRKRTKPGERNRIDLGTGDLIAPIAFEISSLSFNPTSTLFIFVGAVVSLFVFVYILSKRKIVLPALPPIVLGMLLFFGIGLILGFY